MDILYARCCGLDIHNKFVVACCRTIGPSGEVRSDVRRFATDTGALEALGAWLATEGVTHVVMESTGVFWKPVWNVLEARFTLLLVNAQHVKQVPGRKTDVSDAAWLAQLLQCGLLRGSFVPPRPQRELRDLTRARTKLSDQHTGVTNRIHKVLEDANIKLGTVASDILGVSGRAMLEAIVAGESDPAVLADLARRRLRGKIPALAVVLRGHVTDHHRFQLKQLLAQLDFLQTQMAEYSARIAEATRPFEATLQQLDTAPGIDRLVAEVIVAEVGTTVAPFPDAAHLASWAGLCPGQDETGGKQRRGTTRKGNHWLRRTLTQAAWAATRTKGSHASAQYAALARRRGKKRALIAVAHHLLVGVYHVLAEGIPFKDLGATHFQRLNPEQRQRYLIKQLQQLGVSVTVQPLNAAA
jgi:transposase